jgi:hypothetical protein
MTTINDEWLNDQDFTQKSDSENNEEKNTQETSVTQDSENNEETTIEEEDEDSDDVGSDDLTDMFPSLTLNKSIVIYNILKDNEPLCYVETLEEAREIMWSCAREYRTRLFSDYNTFIREGFNQNKIEITGYYRNFLISYERLFSVFS